MKTKFSNKWKGSKQRRKKRKYLANAPLHLRHKLLSANLSRELRSRYERRSFPLRKGDKVKVMIGKFKNKTGKISKVNLRKLKVSIEGLQIQKKDGTKVEVFFPASNLQVSELVLEDKKRIKALNKGKKEETEKKQDKEIKKDVSKEK